MSNKRKHSPGAGQVPAPRGGAEQANLELLDLLRAELREARGALGDLVRERKAVEQLARDHAEKIIESHVNTCLTEFNAHMNVQMIEWGEGIKRYFDALLDHHINPQKYGRPDAPPLPEVLAAVDVINRAMASGSMAQPGQEPDRG